MHPIFTRPHHDRDHAWRFLVRQAGMEAWQTFGTTHACRRRLEGEFLEVLRRHRAIAPAELSRDPVQAFAHRLAGRASDRGQRIRDLEVDRAVELADRGRGNVPIRPAAVSILESTDALADLRRTTPDAITEPDVTRLEIDYVVAVGLQAGLEPVNGGPPLPPIDLLDIELQAVLNDSPQPQVETAFGLVTTNPPPISFSDL